MTITLATLPQATAQEVFDQVATHLLKQNKKSENLVRCAYRGPDGLKCAAGCLISDQEYDELMEGKPWHMLVDSGDCPVEHHSLICTLQKVHDEGSVEDWSTLLQAVATKFNLIFRVPT